MSLLHGELAWILTQQGVLFSQGAIEKLDTEVDLVTGQTTLHVLWHRNKLLFLDQRESGYGNSSSGSGAGWLNDGSLNGSQEMRAGRLMLLQLTTQGHGYLGGSETLKFLRHFLFALGDPVSQLDHELAHLGKFLISYTMNHGEARGTTYHCVQQRSASSEG